MDEDIDDLAKITKYVFPTAVFANVTCKQDVPVLRPIVMGMYIIDKLHGQRDGGSIFFEDIIYDDVRKTYLLSAHFSKISMTGYRCYTSLWSRNPAMIRYMYLEPFVAPGNNARQRIVIGVISTLSELLPRTFQDYLQHDRTLIRFPHASLLPPHSPYAMPHRVETFRMTVVELLKIELKKMLRPSLPGTAMRAYDLKDNILSEPSDPSVGGFTVKWRLPPGSGVNVLAATHIMNKFPSLVDDIFFSMAEAPPTTFGQQATPASMSMVVTIFFFPLEEEGGQGLRVIDTRSVHSTLDNNLDEQDTWLFDVIGPRACESIDAVKIRGSKRGRNEEAAAASETAEVVELSREIKKSRHARDEPLENAAIPSAPPAPPAKRRHRRKKPKAEGGLLSGLMSYFKSSDEPSVWSSWSDEEEEEERSKDDHLFDD